MHRSKWMVGLIALTLGAAVLALGDGFTAALAATATSPTGTEIVLAGSAI
ncbi:MAG TPA: hypothetical protein PLC08_04400 [Candidatus Bipolaricaulis sp.]|nr:hypothetical protein [Candidatus Bipolaricaulis sp.]HRS13866.1 hypothetical protein [Candidatus Bipolaricaulis sp.]HRU21426.1 hypothetical protein [Candidatus Bipolaricaulis sp.]